MKKIVIFSSLFIGVSASAVTSDQLAKIMNHPEVRAQSLGTNIVKVQEIPGERCRGCHTLRITQMTPIAEQTYKIFTVFSANELQQIDLSKVTK